MTPIPVEGDLLRCRMAMLGLDPYIIECSETQLFHDVERRCAACDIRDVCVTDLKRDPNNPVWQTYCPNAFVFNVLAEACWLPHPYTDIEAR